MYKHFVDVNKFHTKTFALTSNTSTQKPMFHDISRTTRDVFWGSQIEGYFWGTTGGGIPKSYNCLNHIKSHTTPVYLSKGIVSGHMCHDN